MEDRAALVAVVLPVDDSTKLLAFFNKVQVSIVAYGTYLLWQLLHPNYALKVRKPYTKQNPKCRYGKTWITMKDIKMENFSDVPTRDLVLLALLKLSGRGSGLCVEATIKNIKEVLKRDYGRVVTRTRVEQILDESQGFIYGKRGLLSDGRVLIYGINPYKIGQELFTIIKNSEKAVVYGDKYAGIIYDYDTQPLYKIEHDLQDEFDDDEFYDKLKIIRDSYFNRDHPAIKTDKMRGFNDWGPDSQKLIEDLENALWTWAKGAPELT